MVTIKGKIKTFSFLFEACPNSLCQVVEHFSDNTDIYYLHSANSSRATVMGWMLKHNLRPNVLIISTVTVKISRYIKREGEGDKQFTQQW